ncbi:hypothetical protein [Amycolatopsis sp. La24]|uniref:hypothetical protein n=1 Tax=Amycolatopsis sp. La24 TaxID=3028304 RepID=UPI0023AF362A|nr:hypothetical protein [Amycolatopsis sp. La24]
MVTTNGADLVGMLADLARTTSTDKTLPMLGLIRLHTELGFLHGWSTDRFRAAHAVVRIDGEFPGTVFLEAAAVKALESMLRRAGQTRLKVEGDSMTVTDFAATHTVQLVDHYTYPDLPNACKGILPAGTAPGAINGAHLADFAAIAKRRGGRGRPEYIELRQEDEHRPTHVRIGKDYRAWVMPVRDQVNDDAWLPQAW